jgi:hypothetical protein
VPGQPEAVAELIACKLTVTTNANEDQINAFAAQHRSAVPATVAAALGLFMATEKIVEQIRKGVQRTDQESRCGDLGLSNKRLDAFFNGRTTLDRTAEGLGAAVPRLCRICA